MPKIKAFKALRYNPKKIKTLGKVIAPPYDAISPDLEKKLIQANKNNVVTLELGNSKIKDLNKRYSQVKKLFDNFIKNKIIIPDIAENIYLYKQEFIYQNKPYSRLSFLALIKLEPLSKKGILPHENTFSGPKKDRIIHLQKTKTMFSPIFFVFPDNDLKITNILKNSFSSNFSNIIKFTTLDKIKNYLLPIANKTIIKQITDLIENKKLLIADGHHRYETSLYLSKQKNIFPEYALACFSPFPNSSLLLLPTHRLLIKNLIDKNKLISLLKQEFSWEKINLKEIKSALTQATTIFTAYFGDNDALKISLAKKDISKLKGTAKLKVASLHNFLEKNFKLNPKNINFLYTHSEAEAIFKVQKKEVDCAFILASPDIEEVFQLALQGYRMPQKTTYFYPKVPAGITMFNFEKSV